MKRKSDLIILIVLIIAAILAIWSYKSSDKTQDQVATQEEAIELAAIVGKLIVLPQGELPTVATVSDVELLKGQPFFAKAKNGDKVLLYANAKMAYLYDPDANKVLEVAPINLDTADIAPPDTQEEEGQVEEVEE